MPDLSCTVKSCRYNEKETCCLKAIDVSGGGDRENTCCSSFSNKCDSVTDSRAVNSADIENKGCCGGSQTSITCDATDCFYNADCLCEADHVDVCTKGVAAQHSHDTECHSFQRD